MFNFNPGSSEKLLINQNKKMFLQTMVLFYLGRSCSDLCRVERYQLKHLCCLHRTNICDSSETIVFVHSRNGDLIGLLIKIDNIQKEQCHELLFILFKKSEGGGGRSQQ